MSISLQIKTSVRRFFGFNVHIVLWGDAARREMLASKRCDQFLFFFEGELDFGFDFVH